MGPLDQQIGAAVPGYVADEQVLVERSPVLFAVLSKFMLPALQHDIQWDPPRFPVAGGAVQLDFTCRGGLVRDTSLVYPVELEIQPDVIAHESLDAFEETAFEMLCFNRRDDYVDRAVPIEIAAFHIKLNIAFRLDRDIDISREMGAAIRGGAIEGACAEVHFIRGSLVRNTVAIERKDHQVGCAVAVQVAERMQHPARHVPGGQV